MEDPNKSLKPCSSKKKKFIAINVEEEEEEEEEEDSIGKVITINAEEEEEEEEEEEDTIDNDDAGCDFLFAEELGKKFLLCGGRYNDLDPTWINNNDNFPIQAPNPRKEVSIRKALRNKSVGILFAYLKGYDDELYFLRTLIDVYNQLKHQRGAAFEIVFVANIPCHDEAESENRFNNHLNQMPWLAVPVQDSKNWRKHLLKRYNKESSGYKCDLFLFDPNGRRLDHYGEGLQMLIYFFGPDFYPFTEAKEKELIKKYFAPLRSPNKSLEALLGGSDRNFLISYGDGDGDRDYKRVPISQLRGRVVGVYFYHEGKGKHYNRNLMRKLHDIRLRALSERGSIFEVVFVNVDFESGYSSERAFNRFLKKWPWVLALPFKDEKIRALTYTLSKGDSVNSLTIISGGVGDDDFSIGLEGYNIIEEYGFDAYPFTREAGIVNARNRLTQLHLTDFFNATGTTFLRSHHKGIRNKPLTFLQNKKVLLYISNCRKDQEINNLLDLQTKKDSFQVLFLASWWRRSRSLDPMPEKWVGFPRSARLGNLITEIVKIDMAYVLYSSFFIAFDETGKLLKLGGMEQVKKDNEDVPFMTDETFDNVFRKMMIFTKKWNKEVDDELSD